jgi:hypothetical protein
VCALCPPFLGGGTLLKSFSSRAVWQSIVYTPT